MSISPPCPALHHAHEVVGQITVVGNPDPISSRASTLPIVNPPSYAPSRTQETQPAAPPVPPAMASSSSPGIIYALPLVARGTCVLAEFTTTSGNFTTVTRRILEKLPSRSMVKCSLGRAPARLLRLLRVRLASPGSSALPG